MKMHTLRRHELMRYLDKDESHQWKECLICSFIPAFYHKKVKVIEAHWERKYCLVCRMTCEYKHYTVEIILEKTNRKYEALPHMYHRRIMLSCVDLVASHPPVEQSDMGIRYHVNQIGMICDGKCMEELNAPERFIQMLRSEDWYQASYYMNDQTWLSPLIDAMKQWKE